MENYTKELGEATWNFLYTFAKGYPTPASEKTAVSAKKMIQDMSKCYTCSKCRRDFEEYVIQNPPKTCCKNALINYLDKFAEHVEKIKNNGS